MCLQKLLLCQLYLNWLRCRAEHHRTRHDGPLVLPLYDANPRPNSGGSQSGCAGFAVYLLWVRGCKGDT